jgi:hypothetical protein
MILKRGVELTNTSERLFAIGSHVQALSGPKRDSGKEKGFNFAFVNDERLRTLVLDRTDEGIFAWNEGTCICTRTFVLRFRSPDLLGGAVGLLGEVGHLDGLGSTLCQYLISNCSDVQDAAMMVAGMIDWR